MNIEITRKQSFMTTKKICVLLCFRSFLCAKHFFQTKVILFKELSKIFKDFYGKFKDFSRISHNFSIFKDSSSTWCFFKDFSRPVRTMLSAALTAWPRSQGLLVSQYGGRREEKTLFSWFAANKLEKREKTLGTRLINNRLIVSFYPMLIVADGFYKTKRWFCDKVRTFFRLRWFLLFSLSFFFWSFYYEFKKQLSI